jgi:hypothetical protein
MIGRGLRGRRPPPALAITRARRRRPRCHHERPARGAPPRPGPANATTAGPPRRLRTPAHLRAASAQPPRLPPGPRGYPSPPGTDLPAGMNVNATAETCRRCATRKTLAILQPTLRVKTGLSRRPRRPRGPGRSAGHAGNAGHAGHHHDAQGMMIMPWAWTP